MVPGRVAALTWRVPPTSFFVVSAAGRDLAGIGLVIAGIAIHRERQGPTATTGRG